MNSLYAGGFFFKKFGSEWYVFATKDELYPDYKAAGGMGKNKGDKVNGIDLTRDETPLEALTREFFEEQFVKINEAVEIYCLNKTEHSKHYFLITSLVDCPGLDDPVRTSTEYKTGGRRRVLVTRWVKLAEYAVSLYDEHTVPFAKALAEMSSTNEEFYNDNSEVLNRFRNLM